jgi:hypothetical protein
MTSLIVTALYASFFAANGLGSSPGDWHGTSVVFAEITSVESIGDNRYWVQMSPFSTLAGCRAE